MKNHEVWNRCNICGLYFDKRIYSICPICMLKKNISLWKY